MEQLSSEQHPEIFLREILEPGDYCGNSEEFNVAKMKELVGLAKRGLCEMVMKYKVSEDANILGGSFVLTIKIKGRNEKVRKA